MRLILEIVSTATVDNNVVRGQESFSVARRTGLGLHETGTEEAQVVGFLHRTAIDGRSVQIAGHLVDLLARSQRAADARRRTRAHVLLTFDSGRAVNRVRVGQSDRIALRVEFVKVDAAAAKSLAQISFIFNFITFFLYL